MSYLQSIQKRVTLSLIAASLIALASCSEEERQAPAPPRTVRVAEIRLVGGGMGGRVSGMIESRYNAQVGFLVGGRLIERRVDVGMRVAKGDILARLDSADYENRLAVAQSQLSAAKSVLAQAAPQETRQKKLLQQGYGTPMEYERALRALNTAKANLEEGEANLRLARDQLGYATLSAETAGAVTAVGADPGQVVNAGQMVVQISQLDAREAVFSLSEQAVAVATPGLVVRVALQSDTSIAVDGSIREVSPNADPVTGTYTVKVALPDAPDAMRLGAVILGSVEKKGQSVVAVVPSSAVLHPRGESAVWVVSPTEKAVRRRQVKVLRIDADTATLADGVKDGDLVVTAGVDFLAEGQKVSLPVEVAQ